MGPGYGSACFGQAVPINGRRFDKTVHFICQRGIRVNLAHLGVTVQVIAQACGQRFGKGV